MKKKKILKNNNYSKKKVGPEYPGEGATINFGSRACIKSAKLKSSQERRCHLTVF